MDEDELAISIMGRLGAGNLLPGRNTVAGSCTLPLISRAERFGLQSQSGSKSSWSTDNTDSISQVGIILGTNELRCGQILEVGGDAREAVSKVCSRNSGSVSSEGTGGEDGSLGHTIAVHNSVWLGGGTGSGVPDCD